MKIAHKAVTTLGGIFLAALLIAALAPKATHGVVAALVQVANTASNPVLNRDIDRSENEPFSTSLCYGNGGAFPCYLGESQPSSFVVPSTTSDGSAVSELVIDYVDGSCATTAGGVLTDVVIGTSASRNTVNSISFVDHFFTLLQNPNITASNQGHIFTWSTPARIFADPGSSVSFVADSQIETNFGCTVNLTGHLARQ